VTLTWSKNPEMDEGSQAGKDDPGGPKPVGSASQGWEGVVPNPKLKLMDQVREVMRLKHYSIRTERSYGDWIRRYVHFHKMQSRADLGDAESKIELFLSDLAVNGQVAASTQNQAFNALLFLYREVLHQPFENVQAVRADKPVRVPVVLTVEEARLAISAMTGTPQLVVKLLYGSGLRLLEALRLRVQDLDFGLTLGICRSGQQRFPNRRHLGRCGRNPQSRQVPRLCARWGKCAQRKP
jgi:integrase